MSSSSGGAPYLDLSSAGAPGLELSSRGAPELLAIVHARRVPMKEVREVTPGALPELISSSAPGAPAEPPIFGAPGGAADVGARG
ncbi:MAG: hypothetical protein ABR529_07935 [Actinomycetota bacterium]